MKTNIQTNKIFNFGNKITEHILFALVSIISILIFKLIYMLIFSTHAKNMKTVMDTINTHKLDKQMLLIYLKNKYWKNEILQTFFISVTTILISDELWPILNNFLKSYSSEGIPKKIYDGFGFVITNITSGNKWYNYLFKFLLIIVIMSFIIIEREPFENYEDLKKNKKRRGRKSIKFS